MTQYPNEIDDDVAIPAVIDGVTESSGETIDALRKAVFAIESALGTNPQGAAADLKTRLAYFFNDDGTPKSSALIASGLLALPIDNAQVGATAAILESKLDLDIPTQTLQDEIDSNDIDIAALQELYLLLVQDLAQHFLGVSNKHDGYAVTFTGGLVGASSKDSVSLAIHYMWERFNEHRAATTGVEHAASAISFIPTDHGPITATNIQDAITQIDDAFYEDRRRHDDSAHSNGISKDGYVWFAGQAAVNDASAKPIRIPTSPNMIKVGLINSAVVKSKNFNASGLSVSTDSLKIDVTTGYGITRSLTITGIDAAAYPTGYAHVGLKAVVDYLNQQFNNATNHFPVTAFDSPDGEIVLQHNINHPSCTIKVATVSNSAAATLGFTAILDEEISPINNFYLSVDGYRYEELGILTSGSLTQPFSSSSVDFGETTGAGGLEIGSNTFIHVYNHTATSANGTYRISTTSLTTVTLSTALASGTFDYIIYKDTIDSNFSGNFKTIDLYVDSSRNVSSALRQETTLVQATGVKIVEVSQGFVGAEYTFNVGFSSPTYSMYLAPVSGGLGAYAEFDIGFIGYKKVYDANNIDYVTVFVSDPSPTTGTDQVTFYSTEINDSKLLLGTTHTNAASVIEMPLDRRNLGLSGISAIGTEILDGVIADNNRNLRTNGIVRGFDVYGIGGGSNDIITLHGGEAYVGGKKISKIREAITVSNVAVSDGYWNLALGENGNFELYSDLEVGRTSYDILLDQSLTLLYKLIFIGGEITNYVDARLFINNIDRKLSLTVDTRDLGIGQFKTIESAVINSSIGPNNNDLSVDILSDLTLSEALVVNAGLKIRAHGDLTIWDVTLSSGAELECFGNTICTGTITLEAGSTLVVNTGTFTNIVLNSDCTLIVNGDIEIANISVIGNNVTVRGSDIVPIITTDGSDHAISLNASLLNFWLSNVNISVANGFAAVAVGVAGAYDNIRIEDCIFEQSSAFSYPSATTDRQGVMAKVSASTLTNWSIRNNIFRSLSHGIEINSATFALSNITITNNIFTNLNAGVYINTTSGTASNVSIDENYFEDVYNGGTFVSSSTSNSITDVSFRFNAGDNGGTTFGTVFLLYVTSGCASLMASSNVSTGILGTAIYTDSADSVISDNLIVSGTAGFEISSSKSVVSNNIVKTVTQNAIVVNNGTVCTLSSNIMTSTYASGGFVFNSGATLTAIGNSFTETQTGGSTFVIPNGAIFIGNDIVGGRIYMDGAVTPPGRQSIISNNRFDGTYYSSNNFVVLPGTAALEAAIFTGNIIMSSGGISSTVALVSIQSSSSGKLIFANNFIAKRTGGHVLEVTGTAQSIFIDGNHISSLAGTPTRAIYIKSSNVFCTNNVTEGVYGTYEIDIDAGVSNIFVSNNILNGTGAGGSLINNGSSAGNVFIKNNKNVLEAITFSALNALILPAESWIFGGTPDLTSYNLLSDTDGYATVPLNGLPAGARLESVSAIVTTPGAASTLEMAVFVRGTSSHTNTLLGTPLGNDPTVFQVMNIAISPSYNIVSGDEFIVFLSSTAANNIVGQIIAYVRI